MLLDLLDLLGWYQPTYSFEMWFNSLSDFQYIFLGSSWAITHYCMIAIWIKDRKDEKNAPKPIVLNSDETEDTPIKKEHQEERKEGATEQKKEKKGCFYRIVNWTIVLIIIYLLFLLLLPYQ